MACAHYAISSFCPTSADGLQAAFFGRRSFFIVICHRPRKKVTEGPCVGCGVREPKYPVKSMISAGGNFLAHRRDELPGADEMLAGRIVGHVASFNASPRRSKAWNLWRRSKSTAARITGACVPAPYKLHRGASLSSGGFMCRNENKSERS